MPAWQAFGRYNADPPFYYKCIPLTGARPPKVSVHRPPGDFRVELEACTSTRRSETHRRFLGLQSAVITDEKPPRAFQSATIVSFRGFRAAPRSSQILFVAASKKMPSFR